MYIIGIYIYTYIQERVCARVCSAFKLQSFGGPFTTPQSGLCYRTRCSAYTVSLRCVLLRPCASLNANSNVPLHNLHNGSRHVTVTHATVCIRHFTVRQFTPSTFHIAEFRIGTVYSRDVACLTYTVHSLAVNIMHSSWVLGATNSPKPDFHNDSPDSAVQGDASVIIQQGIIYLVWHCNLLCKIQVLLSIVVYSSQKMC